MVRGLLFISVFEILKRSIVDPIRSFFTLGTGPDMSEYERHVLSLDPKRNVLRCSLLWLKQVEAIADSDITLFYTLRDIRNKLTHEFPQLEQFSEHSEIADDLFRMLQLLNKLEAWWFWEYENTLKPPDERAEQGDEVYSGTQLLTGLLVDLAFMKADGQ